MLSVYDTEDREGWYYKRKLNAVRPITFNVVYDSDLKLWRITIKSDSREFQWRDIRMNKDYPFYHVYAGDSIWCKNGQFWIVRPSIEGNLVSSARDKTGDKSQAYSLVDGKICCYAIQVPW